MTLVAPFSEEQTRILVNLRQRYEAWIDAERIVAHLPYDLRRKEVSGRAYLYEIYDKGGSGKRLGRWSAEHASHLESYRIRKAELKRRLETSKSTLDESARLARVARVPMLASDAGSILREADRRHLLGTSFLVAGTASMAAYAIEANGIIPALLDGSTDLELVWTELHPQGDPTLWPMLQAVDSTFAVNPERTFQARNAKSYEVDILVAPSRASTMARTDQPRPIPLHEQEWLLQGKPVDQIVICRDATPARVVAPDPRWCALQKLWISNQPIRDPAKRDTDRVQGMLLLNVVAEAMPQYPLDDDFEQGLPGDLAPYYECWAEQRPPLAAIHRTAGYTN